MLWRRVFSFVVLAGVLNGQYPTGFTRGDLEPFQAVFTDLGVSGLGLRGSSLGSSGLGLKFQG